MGQNYVTAMGLLPDTQNCGLCMRRECRVRFPPQRGLAIPTCITARFTHVPWCIWQYVILQNNMTSDEEVLLVKIFLVELFEYLICKLYIHIYEPRRHITASYSNSPDIPIDMGIFMLVLSLICPLHLSLLCSCNIIRMWQQCNVYYCFIT